MGLLSFLDWLVISTYLIGILSISAYFSLSLKNKREYFVSANSYSAWPLATSVLATQCSTNSILGAPAFVAFASGGGLVWLQYELALPLAMLISMIFIMPIIFSLRVISVYEYLEIRFDEKTRLLLSAFFLITRLIVASITIYGVSVVIQLITGLSFFTSVMIFGFVTVIYDLLGGIKAVVFSDVIQMLILVFVLSLVLNILISQAGGLSALFSVLPENRNVSLDFKNHGFGDGHDFSFWPMFIGGTLLYISYYMCDQSQIQRGLCAKNQQEAQKVLFINGIMRFPLVLLYCLIGVGLAGYAISNPDFINFLAVDGSKPNYNLAVPFFLIEELPKGLVGLALVALFAAAMSSLDSVINSLSAVSMEDFVRKFFKSENWTNSQDLYCCRLLTVFWGGLALIGSFWVGDLASTVIIAVNKIGSLANGPILGVFTLGLLSKRTNGTTVCLGFIAGIILNSYLWIYVSGISWLWWNVTGFICTIILGYLVSYLQPASQAPEEAIWTSSGYLKLMSNSVPYVKFCLLIFWTIALISFLYFIGP